MQNSTSIVSLPSDTLDYILCFLSLQDSCAFLQSHSTFRVLKIEPSSVANALHPFSTKLVHLNSPEGRKFVQAVMTLKRNMPSPTFKSTFITLEQILLEEVKKGNLLDTYVISTIVQNSSIRVTGPRNRVLGAAASAGNLELINKLLEIGDSRKDDLESVVQYSISHAALNGHIHIVNRLFARVLEKGYHPDPVVDAVIKNAAATGNAELLDVTLKWADILKVENIPITSALKLVGNQSDSKVMNKLRWLSVTQTGSDFAKRISSFMTSGS